MVKEATEVTKNKNSSYKTSRVHFNSLGTATSPIYLRVKEPLRYFVNMGEDSYLSGLLMFRPKVDCKFKLRIQLGELESI